MSEKISIITLLHGEKEFIPLIKDNYDRFTNKNNQSNYAQELELVIVDDGKEDLKSSFTDLDNCIYIHLNKEEINKFMDTIDENCKLPNKINLKYHRKIKNLPVGFKRDYACGISSYDYIFHMNSDCIYNKKSIERKINFIKRSGSECIFCDTTLCYDIYGKQLYKSHSPVKIYESTLFHTRNFWKRKGFVWHDTNYEGKQFHYNNGVDRKMDNYFDTIQLLGIHNMNMFNPVKVELENLEIEIPELISDINLTEHPFVKYINDFFNDINPQILGIGSEFLVNVENDTSRWQTNNITEKWKQPKLAGLVKNINNEFNVLLYNSKYPAWDLFNHVQFDIIILETNKNYEQMISIISNCKEYKYIQIKGIFIREDFLDQDLTTTEDIPTSEED